MENYILHIYRREMAESAPGKRRALDRCELVGLLEVAGEERRLAFHGIEELWSLLADADVMVKEDR